ncbi:SagB family peptide dehydrogenase [uncultured Serinicoccus sp.]|uniref:SagB family peptide dehydrogenase n=1 Tax=uncultured Serinicoccus sp. TaxID=735514 RepID=UPI0026327D13|nr:SagB family peptide dehydrogenase [uncultured Serinicoccus sp.]
MKQLQIRYRARSGVLKVHSPDGVILFSGAHAVRVPALDDNGMDRLREGLSRADLVRQLGTTGGELADRWWLDKCVELEGGDLGYEVHPATVRTVGPEPPGSAPDPFRLNVSAYLRPGPGFWWTVSSPEASGSLVVSPACLAILVGLPHPAREDPGDDLIHELLSDARTLGLASGGQDGVGPPRFEGWAFEDALVHERWRYSSGGRLPVGFNGDLGRLATRRHPSGEELGWERARDPMPDLPPGCVSDISSVFLSRRSRTPEGGRGLRSSDFLSMLRLSCRKSLTCAGEEEVKPRGSYASGGALYGIEIFIVVRNVEGLAPGVYFYDAFRDNLWQVGPLSALAKSVLRMAEERLESDPPAALLSMFADYRMYGSKYDGIAYSLLLREAGGLAQSIHLACTAFGLSVTPIGMMDNRLLKSLLPEALNHLEPIHEMVF